MDESILIERLRRNDRKAYSELFDGYFDKLFTFALNMVFREDVANDIVQEVFIAIYEKSVLKNYQGSLKAYLYTSVRNRCYNYLRDAKVEDRNMALYAEAAVYSDNVDMIDREEIRKIARLAKLSVPEEELDGLTADMDQILSFALLFLTHHFIQHTLITLNVHIKSHSIILHFILIVNKYLKTHFFHIHIEIGNLLP